MDRRGETETGGAGQRQHRARANSVDQNRVVAEQNRQPVQDHVHSSAEAEGLQSDRQVEPRANPQPVRLRAGARPRVGPDPEELLSRQKRRANSDKIF